MRRSASAATGDCVASMKVVELAPHVRPAGRFEDVAVDVELVEARIAVGLQHALEALQMRLHALTLAVGRIAKQHRRRIGAAARPVIAHVRPQPSGARLAASRIEHRHRRVVGVQLLGRHHVAAERVDQRCRATGCNHRPSRPASSDRDRSPGARRSAPAGTAAGDRHTSPPARARAAPARPVRARSAATAHSPARCARQFAQLSFGRTWRMTLKCSGTYSSTSLTSSPIRRSAPPQSGQAHAG